MNYLAHAWPLLQAPNVEPYELAGVATPDWLSVAARKTKCRSKHAEPYINSSDPETAALARGIVKHHHDDAWFHESPAFNRLSLSFAKQLRERLSEQSSMRPWFLGHILVELLLDDQLTRREPLQLQRYYELVARADARKVAASVSWFCGKSVGRLSEFIDKFVELRFLEDYADDQRLTMRVNQVLSRVRLPELPNSFLELLPGFRDDVAASVDELMTPPDRRES